MEAIRTSTPAPPRLGQDLLHPLYVMRVAGSPVALLDGVRGAGTAEDCARAIDLRLRLQAAAESICRHLEPAVPRLQDRALSRAVLAAKRGMFRLKPCAPTLLASLSEVLDAGALDALQRFNAELLELHRLESGLVASYERELRESAGALPAAWRDGALRNALAYVNPELHAKLERQFGHGAAPELSAKELRKLEDTLLQYVARSASKTSPLTQFTPVELRAWDSAGTTHPELEYWQRVAATRLHFKPALLQHLLAPVLGDFGRLHAVLPLRLNGSFELRGERARFRTTAPGNVGNGRTYGTGEAAAELAYNGVLRCLRQVYADHGDRPLLAAELAAGMCALAPKLDAGSVIGFLQKVHGLGLLQFDLGGGEQCDALDWALSLAQRLAPALGTPLVAALQGLRDCLQRFVDDDPAARAAVVIEVRERVEALRELTGAERLPALFKPQFFENAYLPESVRPLAPAALAEDAGSLDLLLALSPLVDYNQVVRCQLADFFVARFGVDGICEDVPALLEAFDAVFRPGGMAAPDATGAAAVESAISRDYTSARDAFDSLMERALGQSGEVVLEPEQLRAVVDLLPPALRRRGCSHSLLLQPLPRRADAPRWVVNQVFSGRGSLQSRFLEAATPEQLADVVDYLRAGSRFARFAEVPGVFGFAANRHPPTTEHELGLPPFPASHPEAAVLPLAGLRLRYEADSHSLYFLDAADRRWDVWYQGFLIPALLPRLQRVLAMAFSEGLNQHTMGTMMRRGLIRPQSVVRFPRLRLGSLVLARQMWLLPPAHLPDPELGPAEFFLAVQRWRHEQQLPAEIYLRLSPVATPDGEGVDLAAIDWSNFDFKDLKPVYVDLGSPRLVRLMQRVLKRNRFPATVTEALPRPQDACVRVAGAPHAAELHFELTRPAGAQIADARRWQVLRVAWFEDDRRALVAGPMRQLSEQLRAKGLDRQMLQVHWKYGPHVDLLVECSASQLHGEVLPLARSILLPWLQAHPSATVLDRAAYLQLSRKAGMSELEPGPYLPLLVNNTLGLAVYQPSRALRLPAFVRARENFLSATLPLTFELLEARNRDADACLLALAAMMGLLGETYGAGGLALGYVSFRSHAEYFFAAHDAKGALRQRFDALDARLGAQIDACLRAVLAADWQALPLDPAVRALMPRWAAACAESGRELQAIVDANHEALLGDATFDRLVEEIAPNADPEYAERMRSREMSAMGRRFYEEAEGRRVQESPEFMAYRANVNLFYLLLPMLGLSPMQKFCLCHLVALSVERVLGVSWRRIMGLPELEVG
ncbi:lantibiotic dehydratase [Aquimonas voraii]|uniref:Lantibiotic biosynthesis dehydratase C-term n=1 Tax=Aquimonas voraii TaxID=265719 RepID=A0A1G6Y285_9GAMM|nr:lantibiotic dehydratase [Aquimonas voraii]SDD84450.1 Lantibiotic biosynthesis dehydratase C-term [Aquimonas voraii]